MVEIASDVPKPDPVILFNGITCFLVVEKEVICSLPAAEAPVALLGAYYNFDIEYPKACKLAGIILEIMLFDKIPRKVPSKISVLLSALGNITL